jgi:hypothetical protein
MSAVSSRRAAHRGALAFFAMTSLALAAQAQSPARPSTQAPDFTFKASAPTPFAADCNGVAQEGTLYPNSEVEPFVAVNPRYPLNLIGVWQQDRWSNGGSQGLGTAYSFNGGVTTDKGATWSAPIKIAARSNTADPATLPTDYWLARSRDGLTWRESRVSRAFDLAKAPVARGYLLGDYQGLVSLGPLFLPFFVKTTDEADKRNDVYLNFALGVAGAAAKNAPSV